MKSIRYISLLILCTLILICCDSIEGQAYFVPKVGLSLPLKPPRIEQYEVNNKKGWALGVELRSSRTPIYFNPGAIIYHHAIDLKEFEGPSGNNGTVIRQEKVTWIRTRIGVGAELINPGKHFNMHLRSGLCPVFALDKPSWVGIPILEKNYRWGYIEYHFGLGFDIGKCNVDIDYQLSLVRNIHMSDIVENNFSLQFGVALR